MFWDAANGVLDPKLEFPKNWDKGEQLNLKVNEKNKLSTKGEVFWAASNERGFAFNEGRGREQTLDTELLWLIFPFILWDLFH